MSKTITVKASKRAMVIWLTRILNDEDVEINDKWIAKQILDTINKTDVE